MESDANLHLKELRVDGGACANNLLMQFQADLLGVPVVRPRVTETTALGAAYLAGLQTGLFGSLEELPRLWARDRRFEPGMDETERDRRYRGWTDAVRRIRTTA